jgi:hypothetical protein
MKKCILTIALACALAVVVASKSNASGVLLTYAEDPGRQISTLDNTSFINFDNLTANAKSSNVAWTDGATPVGTYDNAYILPTDQYGGAGGAGKYIVQSNTLGGVNHVSTTTLTLNTPSAYFGLWWSAGDPANKMTFSLNGSLVASFTTATLVSALPNTYKGNPNPPLGRNPNEKYAFFNIFGEGGTTWDTISFTNLAGSGFESDNHTTRVDPWGAPGQPGETGPEPGIAVAHVDGTTVTPIVAAVPETSTWVMGFLALGAVGFLARRKRELAGHRNAQ